MNNKSDINKFLREYEGFEERGGGPFGIYYSNKDNNSFIALEDLFEHEGWTRDSLKEFTIIPFNYCEDLNAVARIEEKLRKEHWTLFRDVYCNTVSIMWGFATAIERCNALVNLLKEYENELNS